jgi:hypothetical protein
LLDSKALRAVTKSDGTSATDYALAFVEVGSAATACVYSKDSKVMLPILERAYRSLPTESRRGGIECEPWG